jgi:putative FmdB family regulatory protein
VPTYQYACTECGHFFEQFQSFTDDALSECPSCAGKLRKIFNAVGVVFKGSGFYRNDSRSNGSSEDAPAAEKKPEKKSETKVDASSSNGSSSSKSESSTGSSTSSSAAAAS